MEEVIKDIKFLCDQALYFNNICNNEISIEYLQEAKKTLDEYLKKVEEN